MSNAEKRTDSYGHQITIGPDCIIIENEDYAIKTDLPVLLRASNSYDSDQAKIKALVEALNEVTMHMCELAAKHPEDAPLDGPVNTAYKNARAALSLVKGE